MEEAAVRACGQVCALVTQACPDISASVCAGTCQQQAESFAESGRCGAEHYAVLTCVLATQSASTITCVSSSQWQYAGCQGELVAYTECVGG